METRWLVTYDAYKRYYIDRFVWLNIKKKVMSLEEMLGKEL